MTPEPQEWMKEVDTPVPVFVHAPNVVPPLVDAWYSYAVSGQSASGTVAPVQPSSTPPSTARLCLAVSPVVALGVGESLSMMVTVAVPWPTPAPTTWSITMKNCSVGSISLSFPIEIFTCFLPTPVAHVSTFGFGRFR